MAVSEKTERARELRNNPTEAEKKLWKVLRTSQIGVKFRRQYPIGPYFADIVYKDKKLIIEIDGGQHTEEYDRKRTEYLARQGYRILRFWNNEVLRNIEGVMAEIVKNITTPPSIPPQAGGGNSSDGTGQVIEIIHGEVKPSNLNALRVRGGSRLKGDIKISGAKNAALKHMCAALLTDQPVQLQNMPVTLGDVRTLSELLDYLGMTVALRSDGVAMLQAKTIKTTIAPYDLVRKMRASVLVLGPLLAREGQADISMPGGCAIGTRPVDLHLKGFEAMGAVIELDGGYIKARAPKGLKGAHITFPFVSVGATENIMMAATLADGFTILTNAAREPEIVDQGKALIAMGAKIEGLGTSEIRIEGVSSLSGTTYSCIPDRIETGTYMCAVGLAGGEVRLKNTRTDFLSSLIGPLTGAGMEIKQDGDDVFVYRNGSHLKGIDIMTEPYPGFATDLQAQFMAMMTMCKGAGMVTETVFENRFMHVPELCRMGADITVQGNSAIVRGVEKLKGAEVMATDLRASVALVLAGLVAEGETIVNRIYHLERGYENIVEKLTGVGADIERVSER